MAHHAWNPECKVYVGGLKEEANRYDLEDAFSKIGKVVLQTLWIIFKCPSPPPICKRHVRFTQVPFRFSEQKLLFI